MATEELATCLEIMRRQRHDFLNHLQVLSGLLQLHRPEQALNYIKEVTQELEQLGGILHLQWPRLILALLRWSMEAEQQDVQMRLVGSAGLIGFGLDEEKVLKVVDGIWRAVMAALADVPWERRYVTLRLAAEEDGCCFIWEVAANEHLTAGHWREVLMEPAMLAREINGELGWQQQGVDWVLQLRLAAQVSA
ncbi:MAG: Spo0B domain-containing protein [Clostridia bacterium]|nr:Spo0B domain-containing protein [Clostridia bacterium]MBC7346090.1 Spo0B domain-containing protein [Clostridia bacterium]